MIFRNIREHTVELDYILPDYYPEIFRIIRCTASPSVLSQSINGNKLSYEICVTLKIIYCGAGNIIRTVERRQNYSGSAELPDDTGTSPMARIRPRTDYISCRAVTGRRIDVRGQVSVSISVISEKLCPAVTDASGSGILLKKEKINVLSPKICSEKRITVTEDVPLGAEKPAAAEILRAYASVISSEHKCVSNKLAVKGEIRVNMLYACSDSAEELQPMQFTVPFSQIMDMDGLDERYDVKAKVFAENCDICTKSDGSGEAGTVECAVTLFISCTAEKYTESAFASDEFSTKAASSHKTEEIKLSRPQIPVSESRTVKGAVSEHDDTIESVCDSWCEINSVNFIKEEDHSLSAVGKAVLCAMIKCASGEYRILTCEAPFRFENIGNASALTDDFFCDIEAYPISSSYNLTSDNTAELTGEIRLFGEIRDFTRVPLITEITIDEESEQKSGDSCGVLLYFAEKGENLWETAKRCKTPPDVILQENDLGTDIMEESAMIIIPIIS